MNHLLDVTLNLYLDEALHEADLPQVESHLATCSDCRSRLAAMRTLFAELHTLQEVSLSRNLSIPVLRALARPQSLPRSMHLALWFQVVVSLIVSFFATPFILQFVTSRWPAIEIQSLAEFFSQIQNSWVAMLGTVSHFKIPPLPQIPVYDTSDLALLSILSGMSLVWLICNGLLLGKLKRRFP